MSITIKSAREIELMTEAGRILGIVHKELEKALKPGMSTLDIDALGEEVIRSYGCEPSFLNYNGYPASICVSVNDEIIPQVKKVESYGVKILAQLIPEDAEEDVCKLIETKIKSQLSVISLIISTFAR